MIFADFAKAVGQMGDGRFLRVLFYGVGLTILLLAGVTAGFVGLANWIIPEQMTFLGLEVGWLDNVVSWLFGAGMLVLSAFLMVPVASLFTGFFLEDVAAAVEARHYPSLPEVPKIPFSETLQDSVNFFAVLVAVNLVAVILALLFLPLALPIFWIVNGYLLGREYFQLVAMRRLGRQGATQMRRQHRLRVWGAGILMAAPLSIPLLNLFIPVLGAATFTHQYHRLAGSAAARTA